MKNSSINVEFVDPIKQIKESLQNQRAYNIEVRRGWNGDVEVRYTIKCADPEKEIKEILTQEGLKNIRFSNSYNGARVEFAHDDIIDSYALKRKLQDILRKKGYRSN